MTDYDNTNRGALFKNDRKAKDTHPDYNGSINVEGHDYWISGWVKEGRSGRFFSLSVKRKDGSEDRPEAKSEKASSASMLDDDVPF